MPRNTGRPEFAEEETVPPRYYGYRKLRQFSVVIPNGTHQIHAEHIEVKEGAVTFYELANGQRINVRVYSLNFVHFIEEKEDD